MFEELEKMVGKTEDILGEIPKPGEIRKQLETIEKELEREQTKSEEIAHIKPRKGPSRLPGDEEEELPPPPG